MCAIIFLKDPWCILSFILYLNVIVTTSIAVGFVFSIKSLLKLKLLKFNTLTKLVIFLRECICDLFKMRCGYLY